MGDDKHSIKLVGKLLNASDELSSSGAIQSEAFKKVVTGDPTDGRDLYKSVVEFRAIAQHVFATQELPAFTGGMDKGIQRRLAVIVFNRVIPAAEIIENIGRRIGEEEPDILLAWAVEGASRVIRDRDFTIPESSRKAMLEWLYTSDPVLAWVHQRVTVKPIENGQPKVTSAYAYSQFQSWAISEGFKRERLPAINGFVQKITANVLGIQKNNTGGRGFLGMEIEHFDPPTWFELRTGDA